MATRAERRETYRRHLEAAAASGTSLSAYAREHGLSIKTLYRYRRLLQDEATPAAPSFVRVAPAPRPPLAGIQARLPNGIVLAIPGDHPELGSLLRMLAEL